MTQYSKQLSCCTEECRYVFSLLLLQSLDIALVQWFSTRGPSRIQMRPTMLNVTVWTQLKNNFVLQLILGFSLI